MNPRLLVDYALYVLGIERMRLARIHRQIEAMQAESDAARARLTVSRDAVNPRNAAEEKKP